ncbi:uncharacterized protein LOC133299926 [Gastrolobium bilobum]|uniref:uncharacterized protein LOC133299926 n=1 Tax=Gastrolobium bilobum TaxID=150636 RepID=UPI002AB1AEB7|nr:uncharacterized protein LOC133299926 [Gastrolobium bilobum]
MTIPNKRNTWLFGNWNWICGLDWTPHCCGKTPIHKGIRHHHRSSVITNTNVLMASYSNSVTVGVGSLTTCPFTRARTCCTHVHVVTPNAKSRGTLSLSLFNLSRSRSLDILSSPTGTNLRHLNTPLSALNSGLEASITDPNEKTAVLTDAKIVVESEDENKIQLRVDLTGDQTQKVFDRILANLARTAPPVPGFRMQKGGKKLHY